MKRIISLFIILCCLTGCKSTLNNSLYISSIGFEYDGNLTAYFLCNPLNDIIRSEKSELKIEYFTIPVNSVAEGFEKVEEVSPFEVNFMHLQSVIFHKSFIEEGFLESFLQFMKDSRMITYNFYCFTTEKSIGSIFDYESPDTISFQHSLLASPSSVEYKKFGTERLHFLDLANNFYDSNRFVHLPIIDVEEVLNEKKIIKIAGFANLNEKLNFYYLKDFYAMNFLFEQDFVYYVIDNRTYELRNYRFYTDVIDGRFTFLVRFTPIDASEKEKNILKSNIAEELRRFFNTYIEREEGLFFIEEYNYLNKKTLDVLDYEIIILIW